VVVDQVQQWLNAGWTEQAMLQVGKDICDAAAAAFPNQNIKLPIGVTNSILGATDPGHTTALKPRCVVTSRIMSMGTLRWEYRPALTPTGFSCSATP